MRFDLKKRLGLSAAFGLMLPWGAFGETPVGAAFTYQGSLKSSGQLVTANVDMSFSLWDAPGAGSPPTGGLQIGGTQNIPAVPIQNGLFTVTLNSAGQFGPAAMNGSARWLQIVVNGETLAPRQPLTPTLYALGVPGIDGHSLNAADGTPADALYVDNNGRVGIGTTSPLTLLHVSGPNAAFRLQNTNGKTTEVSSDSTGTSCRFDGDELLRFDVNNDPSVPNRPERGIAFGGSVKIIDRLAIHTNTSQEYTFAVSGSSLIKGQKIVLDTPAVGIGTQNPQTALHVKGTTRTDVVEITGGSDVAEPFEIHGGKRVQPGMVVSIDPDRVGELRVATKAYDPTVAGVVSGANGVNAGLVLRQEGSAADGKHPVALTGRVWCWCDADANGPIEPGHLLTTSNTPGHAMKATDHSKAQGAIIGKAMSRLEKGKGLVLVLVNLQ